MNPRELKFLTVAAIVAVGLGLAGCGGGGSSSGGGDQAMMCPEGQVGTYPDCSVPLTTVEMAMAAIAAAETAEAAQAAYDAVKDDVTAAEGEELQAAVDARVMALATMARIDDQKMALSDAAGMIDTSDLSTQALVDAANEGIRALRQAIEDAEDVSDADKAMYMSTLDDAVAAVDMAQDGINTDTRRTNQMAALSGASDTLQAALAALSGSTPTQAQLDAANDARAALNTAIADGADLTDAEKATYVREAANAAAPINTAQMAFEDAQDEDERTRMAAMAVTAKKLYAGLEHGLGTTDNIRTAAYSAPNDTTISVTIGTASPQVLKATKMAVADNRGWEGKQYMASGTGVSGTYEAVVYSDVGAPTMGKKFGNAEAGDDFQYTLSDGMYTIDASTTTAHADRVGGPSFDHTAGVKRFKLPSPNPSGVTKVSLSGSFHGVSGTYTCTPGTGMTCAAEKTAKGFTLGLVTNADDSFAASDTVWSFRPSNPNARVTDSPDTNYSSYGWWIHKSGDGKTFTASAFVDDKGTPPTAITGLDALNGTATYMGGAAGKYALSSSTGGMNDAGHFTARAMLEANFNDDTVEGTIDQFMGADGESRDWSVELMKSDISGTGEITGLDTDTDNQKTKWTIGGTAADSAGEWSGNFKDTVITPADSSGVPKAVTGTFHSVYGRSGRMVGAFGANKQ